MSDRAGGPVLYFCTYFDSNYLLRGLTMYRSLGASGCEFVLYVLALDDAAKALLDSLALPNLRTIAVEELERANPELLPAKASRSRIEYYFTLTPLLPLAVFEREPQAQLATYLDADLYFYESPAQVLAELGGNSVLVTEHRYPPHMLKQLEYGRFNVQFQGFRRDEVGLACLRRWRDQCIEWCYDHVEGERYADQKYLDEWPSLYAGHIVIVQHAGAGVAPWNWSTNPLRLEHGRMRVAGQPLVFYHYHGVKLFGPRLISNGLSNWGLMPWRERRWLYAGYVRALRDTRAWLRERSGTTMPMRDRIIRGKGIGISSMGEIARKAWAPVMLVP